VLRKALFIEHSMTTAADETFVERLEWYRIFIKETLNTSIHHNQSSWWGEGTIFYLTGF